MTIGSILLVVLLVEPPFALAQPGGLPRKEGHEEHNEEIEELEERSKTPLLPPAESMFKLHPPPSKNPNSRRGIPGLQDPQQTQPHVEKHTGQKQRNKKNTSWRFSKKHKDFVTFVVVVVFF